MVAVKNPDYHKDTQQERKEYKEMTFEGLTVSIILANCTRTACRMVNGDFIANTR